jgi:hypothetical protein
LHIRSEPPSQRNKDLAVAGVAYRDAEGDEAERGIGQARVSILTSATYAARLKGSILGCFFRDACHKS